MIKMFLASHGHMASGMKSSVEILAGPCPRMTVFDAYLNQDSVQEHLDAFYKTVTDDDQVLLLSDLYGGSVNQVMYLYKDRPHTRLIAGVNLALVLELCCRESITDEELHQLVEQSRTMLRIVEETDENQQEEETGDFF
jgi:mannose/fructose-specific phosphotransferase system component IIA